MGVDGMDLAIIPGVAVGRFRGVCVGLNSLMERSVVAVMRIGLRQIVATRVRNSFAHASVRKKQDA